MVYSSFVDEVPLGEETTGGRQHEFQAGAKDEDEINRFTVLNVKLDGQKVFSSSRSYFSVMTPYNTEA